MRTRYRWILAGSVAMTAVLASRFDLPQRTRGAASREDRPIVRLEGRDQQILITSSPAGPRYTLRADGHLIADRLTLEELRVQYPAAYQQVENATADSAPTIWAGVETGE